MEASRGRGARLTGRRWEGKDSKKGRKRVVIPTSGTQKPQKIKVFILRKLVFRYPNTRFLVFLLGGPQVEIEESHRMLGKEDFEG